MAITVAVAVVGVRVQSTSIGVGVRAEEELKYITNHLYLDPKRQASAILAPTRGLTSPSCVTPLVEHTNLDPSNQIGPFV